MTNYYDVLGVNPQASQKEIKLAYRKLSKKFHPDVNGDDPFFERMFIKLQGSYEVLSDPTLRSQYDALLLNAKELTPTFKSKVSNHPQIINFSVNKTDIKEGEVFTVTWKVENADVVHIKPFGTFSAEGAEHFKFNRLERPQINVVLLATNAETGVSTRDYISLNNLSYNTGFWATQLRAGYAIFVIKLLVILVILAFIVAIIIFGIEVNDPVESLKYKP